MVIGSGGHARVIIETAQLMGEQLVGIIDVNFTGKEETILGVPVLGDLSALSDHRTADITVFIALGNNPDRRKVCETIRKQGFELSVLIHPSAIISESARIEAGVYVGAGAIVNPQAEISEGTIVNTGVIIEHETRIGAFNHIGPGSTICGRVTIGADSFIGAGTTVIDKLTIGDSVTVGAGSVVIRDLDSGSTNVGNPSRVVK